MTSPEFTDSLRRGLHDSVRDVTPSSGSYERAQAAGLARWRRRRRTQHLAGVVAILTLVAGCALAWTLPSSPSHQRVQTVTSPPARSAGRTATPAEYRALARKEATHLLSLARLPAGSVRTAHPVHSLAQPINGEPSGSLDFIRSWTVPEPYNRALAWLHAHAPKGARTGIGGSASNEGVVTWRDGGYVLFASDTVAWGEAELEVAATADGPRDTAIRIDAVVATLNPIPQKDTTLGSRIHVDVATGCPKTIRSYVDVTNPGINLPSSLLPSGDPTEGLLCGYGLNLTLVKHRTLNQSESQDLAQEARAVLLSHPAIYPKTVQKFNPGGCDIFLGDDWILVFAYSHYPDIDLWLHPGCITNLDNGQITADQDGTLAKLGNPQSIKR